jgi:hypothetical protein
MDDISTLVTLVPAKCLTFNSQEQIEALSVLVSKRPALKELLKLAIECPEVFNP